MREEGRMSFPVPAGSSPGVPDAERLQAAVDFVVERLRPDQVVLFGSAARGALSAHSDLDFLVIREPPPGSPRAGRYHWSCPATGDDVDVVLRDRGAVQAARRSATAVEAAAVEEGRIVYAREGAALLPTGPERIGNGAVMVRHTLFEPDKSLDFLAQARDILQVAENPERQAAFRCEMLQASLERSLKALVSAQGVRVEHTHDLNKLWDQAEKCGEPPGAVRDRAALDRLSRYAGHWSYDYPSDENPDRTWADTRAVVRAVLRHAERRVPALVEETRRALRPPPSSDDR